MVKYLIKISLIISFVFPFGCRNQFDWVNTLPKPWLLDEHEVSDLLPKFFERYSDFETRLKAITLWRIGTPYEEFKLGEEVYPDADPLFRVDVSDCTVHVLTTLTMAQSKDWKQARENITKIHYKLDDSGIQNPTYKTRWHFTVDRILSNQSTLNITDELIEENDLKTVELVLNKKRDSSNLLDLNWTKNIQISYVPNENINKNLLDKLPEICGIAFVCESYFKNGLAIAHEGILIDREYLVHASSMEGKTVKTNLLEYYFNNDNPRFDGIMIYKFVPLSP